MKPYVKRIRKAPVRDWKEQVRKKFGRIKNGRMVGRRMRETGMTDIHIGISDENMTMGRRVGK